MPSFITNAVQVQRFADALYNVAVGTTTMAQVTADITSTGGLDNALNAYFSSSFAGVSTTTIAANMCTNLGIVAGSNGLVAADVTTAQNYITGTLNAAAANARGAAVKGILNNLSALTNDKVFGAVATKFNNDVDNATAYTGAADVVAGSVVPTLPPFALTVGSDNFTGRAGNDTFDGSLTATSQQTLTATDSIDGGAGTDTLLATINQSVTPLSINNVEIIQVGSITNASTLDLSNAKGITTLNMAGSTSPLTVAGVSKAVNVTIRDTAQNETLVFNDVTGSSDAVTVNVSNITANTAPTVTIAGVEALTYNVTGATANSITSSIAQTTSLTVTGTTSINLNSLGTTVKTLAGSAHAPTDNVGITATLSATSVVVSGGSGNDTFTISSTGSDSVSGGTGNDSITFSTAGGLSVTDTIDGGAGTDTLRATTSDLAGISGSAPSTYLITNIETLSVSNTFAGTIRVPNISTSSNRINLAPITDANVGTGTLVGPAGAFTVQLGGATSGVTYTALNTILSGALTISGTGSATTDTLTITNGALTASTGGTALNVYNNQAITINSYETVSLSTGTVGGVTPNTISTLTVNPDVGGRAAVTLTGANALTFSGVVTADSIDASALAGAMIMANVANTATSITGGVGADTIYGSSGVSDFISAGAGDDNIFGGAGNDTLIGGDGADTITAAGGNDSISAGAGNDTIVMAGNLTSADTIDGGDGTDTLTISSALATTGTPNFTSIEVLGISAASVTQDMNAFSGTGITTMLIDSTGDSITNAGSNLATLNVSANATNGTLSFARLINTTNDSLTMNFNGTSTILANGSSFAGEENLTLGRYGTASGAAGTVTLTTPTMTQLKVLTLNGDMSYAITTSGATALSNINAPSATGTINVDASASTVNLTTNISGVSAITISGGSGNDVITGGNGADSLSGGDGADNITGNAGNDTISGGRGADTLAAGDGVDTLDVGTQNLNGVYDTGGNAASTGVVVNLGTTSQSAANVVTATTLTGTAAYVGTGISQVTTGQVAYLGTLQLGTSQQSAVSSVLKTTSGFENIIGTTGGDMLIGSSSANTISGGTGADYIDGGAGNDSIVGGAGGDYLVGGAGGDTFDYTTLTDSVTTSALTAHAGDTVNAFTATEDFFDVSAAAVLAIALRGAALPTSTTAWDTNFGITVAAAYAAASGGAVLGANQAMLMTVTGTNAGLYLLINDGTAAYSGTADAIILLTGTVGTIAAANFI